MMGDYYKSRRKLVEVCLARGPTIITSGHNNSNKVYSSRKTRKIVTTRV